MRKISFLILGLGAFVYAGSAWAVVDKTVTITDKDGKPIPEQTVTISRVDKKDGPRTTTAKTDKDGKITIKRGETDKDDDAQLIITIGEGARKLTTRKSTKELFDGGKVDFSDRFPAQTESGDLPTEKKPELTSGDKPSKAAVEKTTPQVKKAAVEKSVPKEISKSEGGRAPERTTTSKNSTHTKTAKSTSSKSSKAKEEDKVQVHIEFFSTRSGGSGFSSGGYSR